MSRWTKDSTLTAAAFVGLASGGLSLALWSAPRVPPTANPIGPDPVGLSERLDLLADRLAKLERVPVADAQPVQVDLMEAPALPSDDDVRFELESLERRLSALSARLDAWILDDRERYEEDVDATLAGTRLAADAIAGLQETFLDASNDWDTRIDALDMLNRFPRESHALAGVLPVLSELLDGLESRELDRLIRTIDGTTDQDVALVLLARRDREGDVKRRSEILRALRNAGDLPAVRFALEAAAPRDDREGRIARTILRRYEYDIPRTR